MGDTKDPGSALFRRFRAAFVGIEKGIGRETLTRLNLTNEPEWVVNLARETLLWAQDLYDKSVFPRDDYKESLAWLIWHLGGETRDFFLIRMPGPDDQSRWMSKTIYYPKILGCSKLFNLSPKELSDAEQCTKFVCLFYGCAWFEAPLASIAARSDLHFISQMLRYYRFVAKYILFAENLKQ